MSRIRMAQESVMPSHAGTDIRLALAVLEQAINDVLAGERTIARTQHYHERLQTAREARRWLLHDLQQDGHHIGDILREIGMPPLTEEGLEYLLETKRKTNRHRRSAEMSGRTRMHRQEGHV